MNTSKLLHQHLGTSLKAILLISIFSLGMTQAKGQGSIQGTIVNPDEGITLPGAHVVIRQGNSIIADVSDVDGKFWLKPLNAGEYDIEITYTGYEKHIVKDVVVHSDQITRLDEVELKAGIGMDTVVVIAYKHPIIRDDGGMQMVMTSQDLDLSATKQDVKLTLSKISTDITMDENTRELHFRGSRADDFIYIIDGMKQRGGEVHIPSGAIKSMTVYAGGIPAQYGDFTGGVIIIETKGYFDWLREQD